MPKALTQISPRHQKDSHQYVAKMFLLRICLCSQQFPGVLPCPLVALPQHRFVGLQAHEAATSSAASQKELHVALTKNRVNVVLVY